MKRKMRSVVAALCFALCVTGCGSEAPKEDKKIAEVSKDGDTKETEEKKEEETKEETEAAKGDATVTEQVLYDENEIKITATGLEDSIWGKELQLLIENNMDKSITVQVRKLSVNGFMIEPMMSEDVASGKKANSSITMMSNELETCGIEEIASMEFLFHIFDGESWDEIVDTDMIKVDTSIAEGFEQKVDDAGEVLVEQNGVKIVGKGLSENDSIWGPGVILYIENNSEKDITIQTRDVSVNGFMVDPIISEDVVAGKKAMSAVQFMDSQLEENKIEDISDVELSFHVFEEENWDTIFDTETISLKFE